MCGLGEGVGVCSDPILKTRKGALKLAYMYRGFPYFRPGLILSFDVNISSGS